MEETGEQQTLFMQHDVKYMVIYISNTGEKLRGRFNADTIPKTDQKTMNLQPTYRNTSTILTKIFKF